MSGARGRGPVDDDRSVTTTPIFDELVALYLSEEAPARPHEQRPPHAPDEGRPQWPAVGVLEQWWSQCTRTAG